VVIPSYALHVTGAGPWEELCAELLGRDIVLVRA